VRAAQEAQRKALALLPDGVKDFPQAITPD